MLIHSHNFTPLTSVTTIGVDNDVQLKQIVNV